MKAASPSRRRAQSCQIYGFSCKLAVLGCCGNDLDVCMFANEWCDFPTQKKQKQRAAILMEMCPSRSTSHGEGVLHINSEGMHSCSELRSWPIKRARATSLHISHFRSSVISFMHHNRLIAHQPMGDRLSVQLLPDTSHFYSDRARLPSFGRAPWRCVFGKCVRLVRSREGLGNSEMESPHNLPRHLLRFKDELVGF